jgi:hypothetical protein
MSDKESLANAAVNWDADTGSVPTPRPKPRPWCTQGLIAGIIGLVVGSSCLAAAPHESVPVFTFYMVAPSLHPAGTLAGFVDVGYLACLVLLTTALRVLIVSIVNGRYISAGAATIIRSVETCITQPAIYVLLAAICGVTDIHLAVTLSFLGAVMGACGMAMDIYNNIALGRTGEILNGLVSCVSLLCVWTVLFLHLTHMPAPRFIRFVAASQFLGAIVVRTLQFVRICCSGKLTRGKFETVMDWTLIACSSVLAVSLTAGIIASHKGYI